MAPKVLWNVIDMFIIYRHWLLWKLQKSHRTSYANCFVLFSILSSKLKCHISPVVKYRQNQKPKWCRGVPVILSSSTLVTVFTESGYGIHWVWLRYSSSLVTVFTESGYGIHRVWLRYSPSLVTVFTEAGYSIHRVWLRYSASHLTYNVADHCRDAQDDHSII